MKSPTCPTTRFIVLSLTVIIGLAFGTPSPTLATIIDLPNTNTSIANWGPVPYPPPYTHQSYAQSFTAPAGDSYLNNFRLNLNTGGDFNFRAYVYGWTGNWTNGQLVGSALYTSPVTRLVGSQEPENFYEFAPNIPVTPGNSYVAFVSAYGVDNSPGWGSAGGNSSNYFPLGLFYSKEGNPFDGGNWTSWSSFGGSPLNLEFRAVFSNSVPEPSALALLGMGGLGLMGYVYRRRRG